MKKNYLPKNPNLIPKKSEKVFSGKIFDVYQWQQEKFDGSFGLWEMLKRPDTVLVIPIIRDKIVIIKEKQPGDKEFSYGFPCGRVDKDEDILEAAKREIREETGMEFANFHHIESTQPQFKIEWFVHTFVATDMTKMGNQNLDQGGEIIEVIEVSIDELIPMLKNLTIEFCILHKILLNEGEEGLRKCFDNF